jgi:hypothetical protein
MSPSAPEAEIRTETLAAPKRWNQTDAAAAEPERLAAQAAFAWPAHAARRTETSRQAGSSELSRRRDNLSFSHHKTPCLRRGYAPSLNMTIKTGSWSAKIPAGHMQISISSGPPHGINRLSLLPHRGPGRVAPFGSAGRLSVPLRAAPRRARSGQNSDGDRDARRRQGARYVLLRDDQPDQRRIMVPPPPRRAMA